MAPKGEKHLTGLVDQTGVQVLEVVPVRGDLSIMAAELC